MAFDPEYWFNRPFLNTIEGPGDPILTDESAFKGVKGHLGSERTDGRGWLFGNNSALMDVVDAIGEFGDNFPGMPDYTPETMRRRLNQLRTAAGQDPTSYAKQVAGHVGRTLQSPYVQLGSLGLGMMAGPGFLSTGNAVKDALIQTIGPFAVDYGASTATELGAPEIAAQDAKTAKPSSQEGPVQGPPRMLTREHIRNMVNSGQPIRIDKDDVLAPDVGGGPLSRYHHSESYAESTIDPQEAKAATEMFRVAYNDVFKRYKSQLDAAGMNPKKAREMEAEISQRAAREALAYVPERLKRRVMSQMGISASTLQGGEADQDDKLPDGETGNEALDAVKSALLVGGTAAALLLAAKLFGPKGAKAAVEAAKAAAPEASKAVPFATDVLGKGNRVVDAISKVERKSTADMFVPVKKLRAGMLAKEAQGAADDVAMTGARKAIMDKMRAGMLEKEAQGIADDAAMTGARKALMDKVRAAEGSGRTPMTAENARDFYGDIFNRLRGR